MSSRQVRAELLAVMAEFESKAEDSPSDILSMIRQANLAD